MGQRIWQQRGRAPRDESQNRRSPLHKQCSFLEVSAVGSCAIYQFLLGWNTYKKYSEYFENRIVLRNRFTPLNPRPNQPKKKYRFKAAFGRHFFPQQNSFSWVWRWFNIGNRLQETQPNRILRKRPNTGVHNNQDQIWFVKIGEYRGFMLIAGPDYYGPP